MKSIQIRCQQEHSLPGLQVEGPGERHGFHAQNLHPSVSFVATQGTNALSGPASQMGMKLESISGEGRDGGHSGKKCRW